VTRSGVIRGLLLVGGALPFIFWALSVMSWPAAHALDPWFRFQCHNMTERMLAASGHYFPVCSRCLGIYGGLAMAAVLARPRLTPSHRRAWILGAVVFMVLEVIVQDRTGHRPYHALRLLTGALLAWPIALTLMGVQR
jgi:uncharacterized membrane protein